MISYCPCANLFIYSILAAAPFLAVMIDKLQLVSNVTLRYVSKRHEQSFSEQDIQHWETRIKEMMQIGQKKQNRAKGTIRLNVHLLLTYIVYLACFRKSRAGIYWPNVLLWLPSLHSLH